ncbi:MAG: YncE family protein [Gammaproteobacteria bacterium]|nr:YncE family protein [Gammaproteobacteria bacterium]
MKLKNALTGLLIFGTSINSLYASPTVYIPLGSGNQVIAVDAATDSITASYPGVDNPHGLVATPDGEYLIAGSLKEEPLKPGDPKDKDNSKLFKIHPAHGHVMSTIPVKGWTHHQAITPDGRYVLSTHGLRGKVSVLDMQENKILRYIKTGMVPNYTVITKNGKRAYVSNTGGNNISEIDLENWKVLRQLESGPAPEHITFSGDESIIYVANPGTGKVSAVSVKTGKVSKTYSVGKAVHGLDIGDDGKTLFISSKQENKLVSIDTDSGTKREIALSPVPYHLNTIRGTGKVYVSSRKQPLIWVVDQKTMKVINTIKLPAGEAHQMTVVN